MESSERVVIETVDGRIFGVPLNRVADLYPGATVLRWIDGRPYAVVPPVETPVVGDPVEAEPVEAEPTVGVEPDGLLAERTVGSAEARDDPSPFRRRTRG